MMPSEWQGSVEAWNNFTPRAQQVLTLAREEAERFHHHFVGTEHLLLGLIRVGQGTAVAVLRKMGLDLEVVRLEVEKQVGTGPDEKVYGSIPYTPRVKKVLALADKERKALNHTYLGTEHILLGLLREGEGVAGRVLKSLGVEVEAARHNVLKELDPDFSVNLEEIARVEQQQQMGQRQPVDITKRYDVHCREGDQVVVYRNVLFKGIKTLFPKMESDVWSDYVELEQANGETIFVGKVWVLKFCEHGKTPGPEVLNP